MAGTAFTTMDTAKMIGQSIRNGSVFRENVARHPFIGVLLGDASDAMFGQGKGFNFERLNRIDGDGPRFHIDVAELTATDLVLGSSGAGGEGAMRDYEFAAPTVSIQTGWKAVKVESTIYESDMETQKGKSLITESIAMTEAKRVKEAMRVKLASMVFGNNLPAKNSFGGLVALVSDGQTQAEREAWDSTLTGAQDETAYQSYGVDSSDSAYANFRSIVKPWTSTLPTVQAVCNLIETQKARAECNPNQVLAGISNYQTWRDALDSTSGAIVTELNTKKQALGITGFSYRGNDFMMDYDVNRYCPLNFFALDPDSFVFHMKNVVAASDYKRSEVLNAAYISQQIMYAQLTLGSRRSNIKWCQV